MPTPTSATDRFGERNSAMGKKSSIVQIRALLPPSLSRRVP